jgi:hypothetical protein
MHGALYITTPGVPITITMAYVGSATSLESDIGTRNRFVPLDDLESARIINA